MEDTNFRSDVSTAVDKIDWNRAEFDVYATVPYCQDKNGPVFAPAFNSLWMIKSKFDGEANTSLKLWFFQSASANGTPSTAYFGLNYDTPIISRCGAKFSPLSDEKNFYRGTIKRDPIEIKIEVFHHQHGPLVSNPYLTVHLSLIHI